MAIDCIVRSGATVCFRVLHAVNPFRRGVMVPNDPGHVLRRKTCLPKSAPTQTLALKIRNSYLRSWSVQNMIDQMWFAKAEFSFGSKMQAIVRIWH
jgi:hypothetical protein